MQTHLENLGTLKRRLDVSLPQEQIETEVENRLKRIARTARLHGFRPGKVPFKVVAQTYGPQVRQEVMGDAVQRSFAEAVRQQNLRVAGFPQFEAKTMADSSGDFSYSAIFEVYPEVTVGELSGASIERPVHEVTEEDVDKTIEVLRKQRVTYEAAQRAAAEGDRVVIDYWGTIDGAQFDGGAAQDFGVVLGEGRLLEGFETNLKGLCAGDRCEFELQFPEDYHGKEVAGKTAKFEVTLKRVEARRLPEVDAAFAKALGIEDGDLENMRGEIRSNIEREIKRRVQSRIKDQVMQALLDASTLEVPGALVESEVQRLSHAARQDLEARGIKVGDMPIPPDVFQEQARRRVRLGLVLGEVVKANGLHAKPEQVRSFVEDFAQSYERPEEVVKWYYAKPERLNDAEALALEANVVDWVLGKARVVDKTVGFDELMEK